jgi:hypothetical protein
MPPSEWDDNTWYDQGEFPPASRDEGRGGMIAAAVFSFLMCVVNAVLAVCFGTCLGWCLLINVQNQQFNFLPAALVESFIWLFLVVGTVSGVCFFLQLYSGIGLLRGRRIARTMTLFLAVYSFLLAIGMVAMVVYAIVNGNVNEGAEQGAVVIIGAAILHATYAIAEFTLLLHPSVARRYR